MYMNTEEQFVIDLSKHTETVRPYSILEKEDFYTEQYKKMDTTYAEKHFLVTIGKDSQFLHWIEKNYRYMKIMKVAEYYHLYNGSKKGHKVGGFIGFMAVADKKLPALVPKNMTFYDWYYNHKIHIYRGISKGHYRSKSTYWSIFKDYALQFTHNEWFATMEDESKWGKLGKDGRLLEKEVIPHNTFFYIWEEAQVVIM